MRRIFRKLRQTTTPRSFPNRIQIKPIILKASSSFRHFSIPSTQRQQQLQTKPTPAEEEEGNEEDEGPIEELDELEEDQSTSDVETSILPVQQTAITLRPYQLDCEEHCLSAFREDADPQFSRIGVSAPTGSGKTAIFTSLIRRLAPLIHPERETLATRVLILVGSIELARQASNHVVRTWPDLTVEIEQGAKNVASGMADVTIATYQTLSRGEFARLNKFVPNFYKAVIVDEAHHAAAKSYLSILAHFDSRINDGLAESIFDEQQIPAREITHKDNLPPVASNVSLDLLPVEQPRMAQFDADGNVFVPIIGFTATFGRADGFSLGKIFEKIVWHGEWLDMIRGKWLSELRFTTVVLDQMDLSSVSTTSKGDFSPSALAAAVDKREVRELAISAWIEKAQNCKSTLVFAVNVAHILSLTHGFRELGIDARFVHEGTHSKVRSETLRAFKEQEFPVLVNCGILTEGADFPAIDCVLLARPTKSHNLFLQMIGRGLRLHPGKDSCLIIDLVGNSTAGLMCTPTLFGIDPDSAIENKSTKDLETLKEDRLARDELQAAKQAEADRLAFTQAGTLDRSITYTDYATVFDLVAQSNSTSSDDKPQLANSLSKLSWVGCGDGIYVLELPWRGYMKISPSAQHHDPPKYDLQLHRKTPFGDYQKPVFLGSHTSLPILIRKADADFKNHPELKEGPDVSKYARWRIEDATISQKAIIVKKSFPKEDQKQFIMDNQGKSIRNVTPSEKLERGEPLWLDGVWIGKQNEVDINLLTKGQASDIICRMMHGGVGFLRKRKKDAERKLKKEKKVNRLTF